MEWGILVEVFTKIIGSAINGTTQSKLIDRNIEEYKEARDDIRKAAMEYSGGAAYDAMLNKGKQTAEFMGRTADTTSKINTNPGGADVMSTAAQAAEPTAGAVMDGYAQGTDNAANLMNAKYDKATKYAQTKMKQADIDYNVGSQAVQGVTKGIANLGSTAKDIGSSNMRVNNAKYGGI